MEAGSRVLTQLQTLWSGLDARRRLIAVLSALAIVASVVGIARVATAPDMALLYSGLDAAAAGEVVAALEARGIPYEVQEASIYVDGARRDATRMALATEGLPASGPAGYELLDALSGFGTTSQMFDAAYWRAKEGELARTITAAPNVRAARVHLANPVNAPFARTPTGSASVTVTEAEPDGVRANGWATGLARWTRAARTFGEPVMVRASSPSLARQ
jgi:flagellar M-ring protein FliF